MKGQLTPDDRHELRCERCGKTLRPGSEVWVELNCVTGEWARPGSKSWSDGPDSQGGFPMGADCAEAVLLIERAKGQLTPEAAAFEEGFNVGRMSFVTPKDPETVREFAQVVLPKQALEFAAGVQAGIDANERGRAGDDVLTQAWTRYKISIAEPVRCPGCQRYDCYSLACKFNVEDSPC